MDFSWQSTSNEVTSFTLQLPVSALPLINLKYFGKKTRLVVSFDSYVSYSYE